MRPLRQRALQIRSRQGSPPPDKESSGCCREGREAGAAQAGAQGAGRAHAARAAREERPAILRMEDYAVEGTEGSDRPQLHRVGRAFPRRQIPAPTPQTSESISEVPQGGALSPTALHPGGCTTDHDLL